MSSPARLDFLPWEYWDTATGQERQRQVQRHAEVATFGATDVATDATAYVSVRMRRSSASITVRPPLRRSTTSR